LTCRQYRQQGSCSFWTHSREGLRGGHVIRTDDTVSWRRVPLLLAGCRELKTRRQPVRGRLPNEDVQCGRRQSLEEDPGNGDLKPCRRRAVFRNQVMTSTSSCICPEIRPGVSPTHLPRNPRTSSASGGCLPAEAIVTAGTQNQMRRRPRNLGNLADCVGRDAANNVAFQSRGKMELSWVMITSRLPLT
jgi:hypothetical protein